MFYIHMSDGTFTGYKFRSFKDAVKECNDYHLPADIRELKPREKSFCDVIYCNLKQSDNIFLRRRS